MLSQYLNHSDNSDAHTLPQTLHQNIRSISKVLEISESIVEKVSEMKGVLFVKFGAEKQKNIESQQSGSSSQSDGLTTEPLELIH